MQFSLVKSASVYWKRFDNTDSPPPLSIISNTFVSFCRVSYIISTLLEMLSMVPYIALSSSVIVHAIIHINAKTALIPLDPSSGVKKDPSKTFYFRDVLNLHSKRQLMNPYACEKEEEHNNHQHMKT